MLVKQVQLLDGPGWGLPEEIKGAAALFPLVVLAIAKPVRDGGPIEGAGRCSAQPSVSSRPRDV